MEGEPTEKISSAEIDDVNIIVVRPRKRVAVGDLLFGGLFQAGVKRQ